MLSLTDGGMETTLIFREGIDLPEFAAFPLLATEGGRAALRRYFEPYVELAGRLGVPLRPRDADVAGERRLGRAARLRAGGGRPASRDGVTLLAELRADAAGEPPVLICGCIGPRGDGYDGTVTMSAEEAEAYHARQVGAFAETDADLVSALTMTYRRGGARHRPSRRRGRHARGDLVHGRDRRAPAERAAARRGDRAGGRGNGRGAALLHDQLRPPDALRAGAGGWRRVARADPRHPGKRLEAEPRRAGRAGPAGRRRPGGARHRVPALQPLLPNLEVLGGCCGTDHRHIAAIAVAWLAE